MKIMDLFLVIMFIIYIILANRDDKNGEDF